MSVPIPPNDQTPPLWRRLITTLLLAIWPAGGFLLLLGSAAGEESVVGRGFAALVEAPWSPPLCSLSPPTCGWREILSSEQVRSL